MQNKRREQELIALLGALGKLLHMKAGCPL